MSYSGVSVTPMTGSATSSRSLAAIDISSPIFYLSLANELNPGTETFRPYLYSFIIELE